MSFFSIMEELKAKKALTSTIFFAIYFECEDAAWTLWPKVSFFSADTDWRLQCGL